MSGPHASRGSTVVGVNVAFAVTALLFTLARFLTRLIIVRDFGPEDYSIGVAVIFSIAMSVCMGEQVQHGLGQHFENLTAGEYQASLKPFWASIWLYYMALTFTKISILFQYYRIIVYERTRIAIWIMMGIVVCYGVATFFDSVFICVPISEFWAPNRQRANNSCVNENSVWYSNAVINILLDVAIVALPMPAVRSLNISTARKIAVMALFALGGFVTLTSIIRLYSIHQIADSSDVTWDNVNAAVWSCIETDVGIMCACLPAVRPLLSHLRGRRDVSTASHYRIPEDTHEMPLSPSSLRTPPSTHQSTFPSARNSAAARHFDQTSSQLSPDNGKSSFLVSATRSEVS